MLSNEHMKGVEGFMQFVRTGFSKDEDIHCPCTKCLNRRKLPQGIVEDHLFFNLMASTYDRWVLHGEPIEVDPPVHVDAEPPNDDDGIGFIEDVLHDDAGLEEEDGFEDDRIPDLLSDLYNSEERADGRNPYLPRC